MRFNRELQERFIRYAKINTRSDANSPTIPSTDRKFDLLKLLVDELKEIGMEDVSLNMRNAYVMATLPSTLDEGDKEVPVIGFISHVDTADFESSNVQPQIHVNYDGEDIVLNEKEKVVLSVADFPNLKNYVGETMITTDGTTLLGADDKAGIAAIMTAMNYLIKHPEIKHGKIRVAFGPDEEIGRGAENFDVKEFNTDFAYTVDGGPVGELSFESFNAALVNVKVRGKAVHPGTAKGVMINANTVLRDFMNQIPKDEVPEKTEGREGFYHIVSMNGTEEKAELEMIIRDHSRSNFEERKALVEYAARFINSQYSKPPLMLKISDEYYNMAEVISEDMTPVDLAKEAMEAVGVEPNIIPIRGGTDGSIISFMGIPTPNIFTGGENFHGKYEFVTVESMIKTTETIIKIIELNAK